METVKKDKKQLFGPKGEDEIIVCIEYDSDGRPFSVCTNEKWDHRRKTWYRPGEGRTGTGVCRNNYDVDWCKSSVQLYYHCSGSGGETDEIIIGQLSNPENPCLIWLAEGQRPIRQDYKKGETVEYPLTHEQCLARGFKIIDQPLDIMGVLDDFTRKQGEAVYNPFEEACQSSTEYCSICDDRFPCDEDNETCRHLFWSPNGYWSGVGSDEGNIDDAKEDILFFASKIKTRILVEMVKALENNSFWLKFHGCMLGPVNIELHGDCDYVFNILDGFDEDQLKTDEEYSKIQDGGYWLVSLEDKKTKEANAKVAKWLRESIIARKTK